MMYVECLSFALLLTKISALSIVEPTDWTVHNANQSIRVPAHVPGGIYSDLQNAGIIGDILYRFNDVKYRWVAHETWTYKGTFQVGAELGHDVANLVLHGVDTVAFVEVNEQPVGATNNMFVRYVFDVRDKLKPGVNTIKVTFTSPIQAANERSKNHFTAPSCVPDSYHGECHVNQLRKMQASFSWDWGPAFPSVGLWKPVKLEFYNSTIIRSVTTTTEKKGSHWLLDIKAFLEANKHEKYWEGQIKAELTVEGHQKISFSKDVQAALDRDGNAEVMLNLTISENVVRMWWPNGFGDQPLYELLITATAKGETAEKSINIGFRTVELIEEDASKKLGNTTAGQGLTFYFKVNGYPIFMKGSNWIPAHILPELGYITSTVDGILEAAKDSNMNMLRVWGGGVYESDLFYERCDQQGILIWQDFLFACSMYPVDNEFIDSVKIEIAQNVKRLQHHPSIAIWAGNNENEVALRGNWYSTQTQFDKYKREYIKLYVNTIKPIVNELDPGRRYLISSPSNGIKSEEDGYISENPYDSHYGDTHYYNYIADNWDMNIYPPTRFASEYGFQSLPTLITMETATNISEDHSLTSPFSLHRQHSPLGYASIVDQIRMHLKLKKSNLRSDQIEEDKEFFKKFVFYSQIVQAMAMKAETEFYRQSQESWYTMGALYWQLNDVWQAPSWSSIDNLRRWKVLQYFAVSFFSPVLVSPRLHPTGDVDVYLINDRLVPLDSATIQVDVFNWSSFTPVETRTFQANADMLSAKKQDIKEDFWKDYNKKEVFLKFSLKAEGVESSPENFVFPRPLKSIKGLKKPNIKFSVSEASSQENEYKYYVDLEVDSIVLFLWLETPPILHSYFEYNGLIITTPTYRVTYVSTVFLTLKELKEMITIQYYYEE